MIADAGFRWVRMDFIWQVTEKQHGVYDFAAYDRLMSALEQHQIKALFILDYGNPLYTEDKSVRTAAARQAFARWALAAAKHFAGRGIIWEIFNEPNNEMFWPPKPDVDEFVALALAVDLAFRAEVPNEKVIGPATGVDFPFLEGCFKAGLLSYWSAVSIHPYRQDDPETAAAHYCRLRKLIQLYAKREVPIISGEWGYSAAWRGMSEDAQAELLARELLTNAANGIPISIWYDWRDDGADASEPEHRFGIVRHEYRANSNYPFEPKPAYFAAKTVNGFRDGFNFEKRVSVRSSEDFVLLFSRGGAQRIAAWTTASRAHTVNILLPNGTYIINNLSGAKVREVSSNSNGVPVELSTSPIFITAKN
ncbi:MAG TPA: cellulase family glycosylhydrolase [Pyrinomonadaceae bacterium]